MIILDQDRKHKILILLEDTVEKSVNVDIMIDGKSIIDNPELVLRYSDEEGVYPPPSYLLLFELYKVLDGYSGD